MLESFAQICHFACFLQSPPYSSGSYDSVKTELSMSAEDLTSGRAQIIDDDDDDHDDHDDSDKINDAEGMDPERLKAFNVSRPCSCSVMKFRQAEK